jgi:hypothetical protein
MAQKLVIGSGLVDLTPEEQARIDASIAAKPDKIIAIAEAEAQAAQDQADITETKQDAVISAIIGSTNAEINTYVETNITNITEAQEAFKKVFKLIKVLFLEGT